MRHVLLTLLLYGLSLSCALAADEPANPELGHLFGLGHPDVFTLSSETVGRDFHIYVRLPEAYSETDQRYPVVYLLDGGILFPMLAPYQFMMEIDGIVPPTILVGISYGGLGYANGNMRSTDYTAPADEPEYWGGAATYQTFLADELLPRIESGYRADPERRVILGQSLGGQFVLFSALTRPGLFHGHIAVNPSLHRNLDYFLDLEIPADAPEPRLFIASAAHDREAFRRPLEKWLEARRGASDRMNLHVEPLPGQYHASSAPAAYRIGMQWLFGEHMAGDASPD